jgi:hypothetical protein
MESGTRVFLLSPASCHGRRAQILMRDAAAFPLALRVREADAPLDEVFTFLSGLYFRGKVAYARAFGRPPAGVAPAYVITSNRGLVPFEEPVTLSTLREFATVPIGTDSPAFIDALLRTAFALDRHLGNATQLVLLGSIATGKYVEPLVQVFGDRLRFPAEFVGRGDMSRGGLMLRCADDGRELRYIPIDAGPRRGPRPPRLEPRPARRRG